jgi:hypothetical protein
VVHAYAVIKVRCAPAFDVAFVFAQVVERDYMDGHDSAAFMASYLSALAPASGSFIQASTMRFRATSHSKHSGRQRLPSEHAFHWNRDGDAQRTQGNRRIPISV